MKPQVIQQEDGTFAVECGGRLYGRYRNRDMAEYRAEQLERSQRPRPAEDRIVASAIDGDA